MIHLALQTEYSFKKSFLHIKDISKHVVDGYVGIADQNNTFGHVALQQQADKHGFKPIFGVRLHVVPDDSKHRTCHLFYVFIAKNDSGLQEIYSLVASAYHQFYFFPKLFESQLQNISDNVFIIEPFKGTGGVVDYTACGQSYGPGNLALDNNNFPEVGDRYAYELLAGARKNGDSYSYFFNDQTYPQHILSSDEWAAEYHNREAMDETRSVALRCKAKIQPADMVKWGGDSDIEKYLDLDKVKIWTDEYEERYQYELGLIVEKDYMDYFLIVADMIKDSKKKMLVGPARGSSAGSLICYLLGITEVDPIEHKLIFERFIDINRFDLPDIDIDFPDTKRGSVIKYLKDKYGRDKVMCLANINRLKARSAIGEFAKGFGIPAYETSGVKDSIIERSAGDDGADKCIEDTFKTTEQGKQFIAKYPKMALAARAENHASHAGKHAAGILVSTLPLCNYGSLDARAEIIQMDKKDAEYLNLLKIDCLGLRTLSILEGVAEQLGKEYGFFYDLPLDDVRTYELFNSLRLSGVFQFEGDALHQIVKQMGVRDFEDITAITALARPGALSSGGTARYIKYVAGEEEPTIYSPEHRNITGSTFGIIIYQEQMMELARVIGSLSWEDVSNLRRATGKKLGEVYVNKFKEKFIKGAIANKYTKDVAETLWEDIAASGSYSFNKSHAVGYSLISYWTAWCKANHPLEFAVASLNNAADDHNARKLLRDMILNEGMEYIAVDPETSGLNWSAVDGKLVGGLMNVKGIGKVKANQIIKSRKDNTPLAKGLQGVMDSPQTPFDIIFPAMHYWHFLYQDPKSHGLMEKPCNISEIDEKGRYVFIGCLVEKNVKTIDSENIDGNKTFLKMKIEDDTDSVSCKIDRFRFESIGKPIAEDGEVDKDWYLIEGRINSDWRVVNVTEIINLNKYFKVDVK